MLPDVQDVELASTIDHVIPAEMDAVTWVACLDLLQVKQAHIAYKKYVIVKLTILLTKRWQNAKYLLSSV